MAKIKVPLRELTNLDVNWVSLVDRGANRIPFRIIKRDQPTKEPAMAINLSTLMLGVRKAAAPAAPTVSAVILAKGDTALAGKAQEILKAEGLDLPNTKVFEDGSLALFDGEDFETGAQVVRLSDSMAVVLKGFDPYSTRLDALSFGEAAAARGYYDGLRSATSLLSESVQTRMYKAESPGDALTEVKTLLNDFNAYVEELTRALPASVFKSETGVSALVDAYAAPVTKVESEVTPVAKAEVTPESVAKSPGEMGFKPCADCKDPEGCEKAGACAAKAVAKTETPNSMEVAMEKLLGAVAGLTESLGTVQKSVDSLGSKVEKIEAAQTATEEKVADALKKADDSARLLKGTVLGSAPGSDPKPTAPVRKSDGDPRTGVFDSALLPRR